MGGATRTALKTSGRRRAAAAILACAILAAAASGAAARTPIATARQRVRTLAHRVGDARNEVAHLQSRILELAGQAASARASLDRVQARLLEAQRERSAAQAELASIRARLDDRARLAFETMGPGTSTAYLLGSSSFADLMDRTVMLDRVQASDEALAEEVQARASRLGSARTVLARVARDRGRVLARIESVRVRMLTAFALQQSALQQLVSERRGAARTAGRLERALAMQSGALPFGDWASRFLQALGAPDCRDNLVVTIAWQANEFTQARWNPLATTHPMPGSTVFNAVGVQDYISLDQGLQATADTLTGGAASFGYAAILDALRSCADAETTAEAINASAWCRGCSDGAYVVELVPMVETYLDQYEGMHV